MALTEKEKLEKQSRRLELHNIILDAQLEMTQIQTELQKNNNDLLKAVSDDKAKKIQ